MNTTELVPEIESAIRNIWPDSYINVGFNAGLYPSITIHFAIGNKDQWSNHIIHNDPGHHIFHIGGVDRYGITDEGEIEGQVELTRTLGGGIRDKSFNLHKVPFRKKKVDSEKAMTLVPAIATYFKRLRAKYDEMTTDQVKVTSTNLRALASKIAIDLKSKAADLLLRASDAMGSNMRMGVGIKVFTDLADKDYAPELAKYLVSHSEELSNTENDFSGETIKIFGKKLQAMGTISSRETSIKNGLVELLSAYMSQTSKEIDLNRFEENDVLDFFDHFLYILYSFFDSDYEGVYTDTRPFLSRDPTEEESNWVSNATDSRLMTIIKKALQKSWPEMSNLLNRYRVEGRKW